MIVGTYCAKVEDELYEYGVMKEEYRMVNGLGGWIPNNYYGEWEIYSIGPTVYERRGYASSMKIAIQLRGEMR